MDEVNEIKKLTVETVYRLNNKEQKNLEKELEKVFHKKVKIDASVNAGILGGIRIKDKSKLYDASFLNFLNNSKV